MEKNNRFTNICATVAINQFAGWTDQQFYYYLEELPYLNGKNFYFVFQREESSNGYQHWQLYCEFNRQVYFHTLQNDFHAAHLTARKESQSQAINYCKKEKTKNGKTYEKGIPRQSSRLKKNSWEHKKVANDELLKKVLKKLKKGSYQDFFSIEDEYPEFFLKNKGILKDLWNRYNPIAFWDIKPARVFWIYGEKGAGKTVWTEKYLREQGYQSAEIVAIFPHSITYNDKITFDIEHEKGKVLVISEVDEEFPKNNNLIAFIDRRGLLEAKESQIRNNFELIIINSLYRPEEVFGCLGKRVAGQVLRRIFSPFFRCKVYGIKQNEQQLAEALSNKQEFSNKEFQNWYQPIVQQIPEPDYSLIEKA